MLGSLIYVNRFLFPVHVVGGEQTTMLYRLKNGTGLYPPWTAVNGRKWCEMLCKTTLHVPQSSSVGLWKQFCKFTPCWSVVVIPRYSQAFGGSAVLRCFGVYSAVVVRIHSVEFGNGNNSVNNIYVCFAKQSVVSIERISRLIRFQLHTVLHIESVSCDCLNMCRNRRRR